MADQWSGKACGDKGIEASSGIGNHYSSLVESNVEEILAKTPTRRKEPLRLLESMTALSDRPTATEAKMRYTPSAQVNPDPILR